jgi:hypothetical protein
MIGSTADRREVTSVMSREGADLLETLTPPPDVPGPLKPERCCFNSQPKPRNPKPKAPTPKSET